MNTNLKSTKIDDIYHINEYGVHICFNLLISQTSDPALYNLRRLDEDPSGTGHLYGYDNA